MSMLSDGLTQIMKLIDKLKQAVAARDSGTMRDCIMQIDALINQQIQILDVDFASTHELRQYSVNYLNALLQCREFVGKGSGISTESKFDVLEQHIVDAAKVVFLFEYELKEKKPDSAILTMQ